MKFGQQLQQEIFPPWRLSYIQYDVLKSELKQRQLAHAWADQDEQDFIELLESELEKVYDFVTAKLNEVEARISYCERTIQTFMNNPSWSSDQNWNVMDEALTEVLFDVNDLAKFTRLNYIGFQKILKKHDKWTGLNLVQGFVPQLRAMPLDKQRFDVAIVFISSLHDVCRLQGKPRTGNAAAGGDQNAFERATAKYWIHPDNVTEVKSIIMLHLPVLIFNKDKRYEPSDSAISSVYFDNDDFDLYTGRLQRDEGAEAIRFRWYGPMSSNSAFIERKTHHASWLDGASVKDRFRLDVAQVPQFVSGELSADAYADRLRAKGTDEKIIQDNHFIASGIQTSLENKHIKPVLRAFYNRTAFQLPGDQRVRVSLDTDLTFIREDDLDGVKRRGPSEWRRPDVGIDYPFSYLDDEEILRFPYAVLETKLQTHLGQQPPEWLTKLVDSHLVHEVPRFSKYLHGACYFHRARMPLLPWWLSEMEIDIHKPRSTNFGLTRSKSFKPLIDGQYRRAMEQEERRMSIVADKANADQVRGPLDRNSFDHDDDLVMSPSPFDDPLMSSATLSPSNKQEPIPRSSSAGNTLIGSPEHKPTLAKPPQEPWKHAGSSSSSPTPSVFMSDVAPEEEQGLKKKKKKNKKNKQDMEMQELGEPVQLDKGSLRLDMKDEEKKPKGLKKILGPKGPVLVEDPNNKGSMIPIKKVKIDPKVFFSNERTLLSWLQFCALLLTVALSLLNLGEGTSKIAGGVFIGVGAVVAIYALYRFEKRAWMINNRVIGRYDDLWGPAVLCALLVGALIVNFYLKFG
ncbi:vacuolar transporter chaperone [Apophysomyces sp. BC1034]|nr:vacuolar transporter chaperone [Apophysomyces sp. BC1015]KAG0180921.1 vacuolar transporter chaperone [Apophysomyces sp. BC1021]KAG0185857.1 vacuolar transporter chaperone [Apophysomyces sp. BC1034]